MEIATRSNPFPSLPADSAAQVHAQVRVDRVEHHYADPGTRVGVQQQLHQPLLVRVPLGEFPQILQEGE